MTSPDWKRVKGIAGEAWALPAGERMAYLADACGTDRALRSEVFSLVAAMDAAADCFEIAPPLPLDGMRMRADLTGRRLGVYEILSRIGGGGMGEVYKARDTRLDRIVAIKTVPSPDSGSISRERTEHEARAVAALSHAHICTLYDVGHHDGLDFLVMQYVEGETLADHLSQGRLKIDEALRYADQIASALGAAHRAGIIHRDVKPANIMLDRGAVQSTGAPQAKLLDFGIAKATSVQAPFVSTLQYTNAAIHLTAIGLVVGTPQYMAPEQIDGHAADVRTDVFAFGTVLFEMLTGRRAFEGRDRLEVLAAIRHQEVSRISTLVPGVPVLLDRVVRRCVEKKPGERYQTMDDLLIDLRAVRRQLDSPSRVASMVFGALVLAVAIGGGVGWALWSGREVESLTPPSVTRLPASAGVLGKAALSPDGSNLVFSWTGDGVDNPELMLMKIGGATRERLTNDLGIEEWPAWSPDGSQIAFIRCDAKQCAIFTLPIRGGTERKVRDLRHDRYYDLAWSPDGRSIVYAERSSPSDPYVLFSLSLDNSLSRRLTTPRSLNLGELRFAFSPDGSMLAIIRIEASIEVLVRSMTNGSETIVLSGQHEWFGGIAWTVDDKRLVLSGNQQGVRSLWTVPLTGGDLQRFAVAGEDSYYPSLSTRTERLAFVHEFRDWDFARVVLERTHVHSSSGFPSSARLDLDPAFSPDGRKLAFVSERSGTREVWVSNADGTEAVQVTAFGGPQVGRPSWSPNGRMLAFHSAGIHVVPAAGGPVRRVTDVGEMPLWSADGQWIYFMHSADGRSQVWKVSAGGGRAVQAITSDAFTARESPDGLDLYFATVNGGIWHRAVAGGPETQVIQDFEWSLSGYWAVVSDGIYYVARESLPDRSVINRLKFFEFARRRAINVGTLTGAIEDWVGGLTLSPDRRTLIYSQRSYQSSEIMLVEHVR